MCCHYPNMLKWIYRHGKQFERPIQFPDDQWAPVDTRIHSKGQERITYL